MNSGYLPLGLCEVIVSDLATTRVWEFPRHPFFEWEPKDEAFCRRFGIGREIERPAVYRIGRQMVMHPGVAAKIPKRA